MRKKRYLFVLRYLLVLMLFGLMPDLANSQETVAKPSSTKTTKALSTPKSASDVADGVERASGSHQVRFSEDSFYASYASFLEDFVTIDGDVSYSGVKAKSDDLDTFVSLLKNFPRGVYDSFNDKQRIAFWLNAYNALMIKVVSDNFPIEVEGEKRENRNFPANSVRQIRGVWSGRKHIVMGRILTLQKIEQQELRKAFVEPRIHFAIVKASKSSPTLRSEPYTGRTLDSQLRHQTIRFLRDPSKFVFEKDSRRVLLSPMFDWFAKDFSAAEKPRGGFAKYPRNYGAVLQFIASHISVQDAELIRTRPLKISYLEYDWRLNDVNVPDLIGYE